MTSSNSSVKPLPEGRNLSSPSLYNPYVPNTLSQLLHCHREQLESEASTRRDNNVIIGQKRQRAKSAAAAAMAAGSSSSIAISSDTSLETLLQERLRQSASMGVSRAKDLAREAAEIEYKEKLLLGGGDAKAKMSDRVKRMMAAAADTEGDLTTAGGAVLPPPPSFDGDEVCTPSLGAHSPTNGGVPLLDTHLEFQRTKQGKHVITTAASSSSSGPKIRLTGKPSSTLLIRNLVLRDTFYGLNNNNNGDPAQFAAAFRERIIAEVSAECSKCGHVKDIVVCDMYQQPPPSTDEQPLSADSTPYPAMPTLASSHPLLPTPASSSPPLPTNNHQRDAIVVWVRMDMVTNGFKAAERINGKVFLGDAARLAVVSFYPNVLFDQGTRTTNADALLLATSSGQSASSSPTASLLPPTFGEATSTTTTSAAAPSLIVEPLETLLPSA